MKVILLPLFPLLGLIAGCTSTTPVATGTWESVQPVLERNCVHCHGAQRLAGMPAMTDTGVLSRFAKYGMWIIPGNPEASRIYQVVKLADDQPGTMPPTGHAITDGEKEVLRAWIANNAPLPPSLVVLTPLEEAPRSR